MKKLCFIKTLSLECTVTEFNSINTRNTGLANVHSATLVSVLSHPTTKGEQRATQTRHQQTMAALKRTETSQTEQQGQQNALDMAVLKSHSEQVGGSPPEKTFIMPANEISLFDGDDDDVTQQGDIAPEQEEGSCVEYKRTLVAPDSSRLDHLVTQLNWRLGEGGGEALYELGFDDDGTARGISPEDMAASIETLRSMAERLGAEVTLLHQREGKHGVVAEAMVRLISDGDFAEVRVAVVGNVDSGKSTLIGVLTKGKLDNGRGRARLNVFRHRHEVENGRTSSVSQQLMGFDAKGEIVNYRDNGGLRDMSWQEIVHQSSKLVTFLDLAGHERYIKTTMYGMTGLVPDYAMIVVGANMGVLKMTKEHIGIALALKVPLVFVVTKLDMCPDHILKKTLDDIQKILHSAGVRKFPFIIKSMADVTKCAKLMRAGSTGGGGGDTCRVSPIFLTSNVTGGSLDLLRSFLNLAPVAKTQPTANGLTLADAPAEVCLDETFYIAGVGTVVAGMVTSGRVKAGATLLLGPDGNGHFEKVQVKTVQYKRVTVAAASAGQSCTFALKKVKRKDIRKGMILCDPSLKPKACVRFSAEILVLHHPTTITNGYQPVVHCVTVRQSTKLIKMEQESLLRTGDRAVCTFQWMFRPEYLKLGARMLFREGRTKGMGKVVRLEFADGTIETLDENPAQPSGLVTEGGNVTADGVGGASATSATSATSAAPEVAAGAGAGAGGVAPPASVAPVVARVCSVEGIDAQLKQGRRESTPVSAGPG